MIDDTGHVCEYVAPSIIVRTVKYRAKSAKNLTEIMQ